MRQHRRVTAAQQRGQHEPDHQRHSAAIGAAFEGGYFAGLYKVGEQTRALIMAGADGEVSARWNPSLAAIAGATSLIDGLANTDAMAAAGSKLAQRVRALRIAGHDDWHIPAKDQLEMLYRAFKPSAEENYTHSGQNAHSTPPGAKYTETSPAQTTVAALREDEPDALIPNWYWSSTQHEAHTVCAWNQGFFNGYQSGFRKPFAGRARAVRSIAI